MYKLGVIPAAGRAERWGGHMKELMPLSTGQALIDHTIAAMTRRVDAVLVVTSSEKLPALAAHLYKWDFPIMYMVQKYGKDILGAIATSFDITADRYYFAMPDTVYNVEAFDHHPDTEFAMGTFKTTTPERFGVLTTVTRESNEIGLLRGPGIVNKQKLEYGEHDAWGVLTWTHDCVRLWLDLRPETYTDALNMAIRAYGVCRWDISGYYDFASHDDYLKYFTERLVIETAGYVGIDGPNCRSPSQLLHVSNSDGEATE